jgi:thiol-disulfide isomerase/thioredoxin
MSLDNVKCLIVVLAMPGCPACDDYTPRFEREVDRWQKHGVPLVYYRPGQKIDRRTIPVMVIDATSTDPNIVAFADLHQISGMPTTLLLTQNAPPVKIEGTIPDEEIYRLLESAAYANR